MDGNFRFLLRLDFQLKFHQFGRKEPEEKEEGEEEEEGRVKN